MRFPNLISALPMVFAETAMGATSPDCVTGKYQRYTEAQRTWLSLSKTDRQQVASESERYAQLRDQARAARSRPAHPSGENLREIMKNEIMTSSEYKDLLQEFLEATKAAEAIKC
ncbi:hypothetical protein [Marinobacter sp. PE14]